MFGCSCWKKMCLFYRCISVVFFLVMYWYRMCFVGLYVYDCFLSLSFGEVFCLLFGGCATVSAKPQDFYINTDCMSVLILKNSLSLSKNCNTTVLLCKTHTRQSQVCQLFVSAWLHVKPPRRHERELGNWVGSRRAGWHLLSKWLMDRAPWLHVLRAACHGTCVVCDTQAEVISLRCWFSPVWS
jgi:hypothetical protein